MTERHFMRKADLAYIGAILLLCGTVYTMAKHPMEWDQDTDRLNKLEPRMTAVESTLVEDRSRNQAQMTLIIRELDEIHKELR